MKKIAALLLVAVLAFSLVGCNARALREAEDNYSKALQDFLNGSIDADEYNEALDNLVSVAGGDADIGMTIEEYLETYKSGDEYSATVEQAEDSGLKIEILAENDNLVYKFAFIEDVGTDAKEYLDQQLMADDRMGTLADTIRTVIPSLKKMIVRYYTNDGKLITSHEY